MQESGHAPAPSAPKDAPEDFRPEDLQEDAAPTKPRAETEAIVAAAKAERDAAGGGAQARLRRCLIVDDSRVVRKVSRKIVESLGYQAVEAENGEEALARCRNAMPHLIITDWQMPVMSGIEFVTRLRAMPADRAPKVVFCTSKSAATDIHEGIAAGADDYIVKPFDEATLKAKLAKIGG